VVTVKRVLLLLVICGIVWFCLPKKENPYPRESFVVVGSPMTVYSWNPRDRSLLRISIPETVAAEGTHGYGTYSLAAFWRLGQIDKKDGSVLAESVSEALGIPVTGYIGAKTGVLTNDIFTFAHSISYLRGVFLTNMSLPAFMHFVWLLRVAKPAHIDDYDFTHNPGLIADDVVIADGSHQLILNPDRVDARLAHIFEDEAVRRETVTTAVYNTTEMQSLGSRVARLLSTLGVSVVYVGNDTQEVDACVVTGTKDALGKGSAKVIQSVLGCVLKEISEPDRADLTVRIGKSYAKRFIPN